MATRYLFYSHDGYGLGHIRRNSLIAQAVLDSDPTAEVSLVTGLEVRTRWLRDGARARVHRVPPLLKGEDGSYRNEDLTFEEAVARRERVFTALVAQERPDVVVVDRHPYGTAGELRTGLEDAHDRGAAVVLGLRDVLDEPGVVRDEMTGRGWDGVDELFDEVLVYGRPHLVDHEAEYCLMRTPTYCGWVVEATRPAHSARNLLVVAAGGGGDGAEVFELAVRLMHELGELRAVFAPGPYADIDAVRRAGLDVSGRARIADHTVACGRWFSRADAVLCMAGYNSTMEALAAGLRPILVPRRSPRREQAIRASRLAALGLADVVDEGADASEIAWLLQRPRALPEAALADARIDLDGAANAAARLAALVPVSARR